jgi:hypothetical protein
MQNAAPGTSRVPLSNPRSNTTKTFAILYACSIFAVSFLYNSKQPKGL